MIITTRQKIVATPRGMKSNFECLLVEENSILLVSGAKVRFLKLQDSDHVLNADQLNPTYFQ